MNNDVNKYKIVDFNEPSGLETNDGKCDINWRCQNIQASWCGHR